MSKESVIILMYIKKYSLRELCRKRRNGNKSFNHKVSLLEKH